MERLAFKHSKDFKVLQIDEGRFCRVGVLMEGITYIFPVVVFPDRVLIPTFDTDVAQLWMQKEIIKALEAKTGTAAGTGDGDFAPVEDADAPKEGRP